MAQYLNQQLITNENYWNFFFLKRGNVKYENYIFSLIKKHKLGLKAKFDANRIQKWETNFLHYPWLP